MDNKGNFKIPGTVVSEISLTQVALEWAMEKIDQTSVKLMSHLRKTDKVNKVEK